ncbi:MAG: GxxExxY protein [Verrucomicrobia bacterium]|nr:GxxExxY protein [Verrucomicrobiota bacterium]
MPLHSAIPLPRLTVSEFKELDYQVMAHAFAAQRDLGRLCDETVYHADLADRLLTAGLGPICRELPLTASFRGFEFTCYADLVVADRALYELKADDTFTPAHDAQLLNYLFLANAARGKLINFRPSSVESRFVNAPLDSAERRRFAVHADQPHPFYSLLHELLLDWGTGLETPLYVRALTYHLGGEAEVIRLLPMTRGASQLGNQRFHLAASDTAFAITSLPRVDRNHRDHLERLLSASPLSRLLWANLAHHHLTFTTIDRSTKF